MKGQLLLALALVGCSADGSAVANHGVANEVAAPSPRQAAGPCAAPVGPETIGNCDFGPVQRMRGIWVTGFEVSAFLPGATAMPGRDDARINRLWLTFAPGAYPDPALRRALDSLRATGAAMMEFDGRQARNGDVVIVDRIVSARLLGPLPRR